MTRRAACAEPRPAGRLNPSLHVVQEGPVSGAERHEIEEANRKDAGNQADDNRGSSRLSAPDEDVIPVPSSDSRCRIGRSAPERGGITAIHVPESAKIGPRRRIPASHRVAGSEPESDLLVTVRNVQRRARFRARVGGPPDLTAPSVALSDFRFRKVFASSIFAFAAGPRMFRALRPFAGFGSRFASIHFDIAAEHALASSGTAAPLSRAIASANDTCAGLGFPIPAGPSLSPSVRFRECWSRNARQTAADFV